MPSLHLVEDDPIEMKSALDDYLATIRAAGHSPATARMYGWHLARLVDWLASRDVNAPSEIGRALLREWAAELYEGWDRATVKQAITAARSWLTWLHSENLIPDDLAGALKTPTVKARVQRTLSAEEIGRLLDACDPATLKGRRDAAIVSLLVDTGLRASELCALWVGDVDGRKRLLRAKVKGGDEELAFFGSDTAKLLNRWLDVRPGNPGVENIFVGIGGTTPGAPLTVSGLFRILRNLGDKAGVPKVSTHSFRRAFACLMTEAGAPTQVTMKAGRWRNEKTFERYLQTLQAGKEYPKYAPMRLVKKSQDGN